MKLTLIGAGPGDPELITLKGLKALKSAKVVLYDALVHPMLLTHCQENCERILVGKRFGKPSCGQDEINMLILANALRYGEVVRLKGGDSFIFGRGYEELSFAAKYGIETEVIPGISSSYAVPAMAGIPLTSRGISESFWVVTGTTKNHELSNDIALAAQSTATVVILMGMHKLQEIVEIYMELQKADMTISIIQNGTRTNQKLVSGRIDDILIKVAASNISSPAIIVIGKVVALANDTISEMLQFSEAQSIF